MSLEFSTIALNDIVSLVIDYRGKTPKKLGSDWSESGIRALSAKNIKTGQIIREDAIRYVDTELYYKWMKDEIKRNDILITSEAPFGEVFFWDSDEKIVLSQRLFGVRCDENKVDPKFIYFYMTSEMFQWELQSRATGTTVKGLRQPELLKCEIQLPNRVNQRKISYILSNIENKINVLKELNKNLEQLSQNLFKKWFIDFDLKNDFNIFESFKESSLGKIPESWEIKTIGDLSEVKGRIGWRGYTTNDLVDDGPWVVGGKEITSGFIDFNSAKHLTREKYEESPEIMLKDKDLIIAKTGTIGPIAMYYDVYGEATLNPNVGLIRSKNIVPALLLTFFKTQRAQYYLNEFTTSSVQPAINQTTIKQLEIALPSDEELLNTIGCKFDEINLLQFNLNEEIKKLQKLRDTLLPKLMSGEIDVSKINCDK